MPKGELFINKDENGDWKDAYLNWGLSMTDMGLSALMTPAPNKEYISSCSRSSHGKRVITTNARVDSRSLTLPVHISAKTKEQFFENYNSFCRELEKGDLVIKTRYSQNVYKCVYQGCSQFTQFVQEMAHFTLKLEEPNPKDRS